MAEEKLAPAAGEAESKNFIHQFIDEDIAEGGRFQAMAVHTRFPPEPNGYLHIGHCKALCIDFGTAEKYGGLCNLRMDDTNPTNEGVEYVEAIQEDIHWLGFDWGDRFFYASLEGLVSSMRRLQRPPYFSAVPKSMHSALQWPMCR